jgi:precorrin-4 methylase
LNSRHAINPGGRTVARMPRCATSLKPSVMPLEIVPGTATFAACALRLRLEYQPQ